MTQTSLSFTFLSSRAVIRLSGADVQNFLQGLITNNMRHLSAQQPLYSALLSPQGKLLFDFFLYADDDDVLLETEASRAEELTKRLKMYKLRADVNITPEPDLKVAVLWGSELPAELPRDPRHASAGARVVCLHDILEKLSSTLGAQTVSETAYDAHRIALNLPDGSRDFVPDKNFAAEIGLEALHGVDFAKGCYVGQEVTARTKHRGTVRKGLCVVRLQSGDMPAAGSILAAGDIEAGELRSVSGNMGLAMLRFEYADQPLNSGDSVLQAQLPAWAPKDAA